MPPGDIPDFQNSLLQWFDACQRDMPWRQTTDPYTIWVSEVMLQQTQVKTVIPYFDRFMDRFPSVHHLAAASLTDVLKLWEGLGYYSRARNLHRAAGIVVSTFQGKIPNTIETFRKLPGVGDYIVAAVQSIAFNRPVAAVDGNVKRVLSRLFEIGLPVNQSGSKSAYQATAEQILACHRPGDYNQAMMELGALICTPGTPDCESCPAREHCLAYRNQTVDHFPVRIKPRPIPVHQIAVGIVLKDNRMLITRRKPEGLLGGLWEFPGGKIETGETAELACVRELKEETGLNIGVVHSLGIVRHAYTHFKIEMAVFICRFQSGRVRLNGPVDSQWIRTDQIDRFPFPKANHKIFPLLKDYMAAQSGSG